MEIKQKVKDFIINKLLLILVIIFVIALLFLYLYKIGIDSDFFSIVVSCSLLIVIFIQSELFKRQIKISETQTNLMEKQNEITEEQLKISEFLNKPNLKIFITDVQGLDIDENRDEIKLNFKYLIYNPTIRKNTVLDIYPKDITIPGPPFLLEMRRTIREEKIDIQAESYIEGEKTEHVCIKLHSRRFLTLDILEKYAESIEITVRDIHQKEYKTQIIEAEISEKLKTFVLKMNPEK